MTNTIQIKQNNAIQSLVDKFFAEKHGNASTEEKQAFLTTCQVHSLNPFKNEIYAVPRRDSSEKKFKLVPTIDYRVYVRKAEETGKIDGWKTEVYRDEKKKITGGKITIYRKDWKYPLEHEVYFDEIVGKNKKGEITKMWQDRPDFMTRKTLIKQGFAMCLPVVQDWDLETGIDLEATNEIIEWYQGEELREEEEIQNANKSLNKEEVTEDHVDNQDKPTFTIKDLKKTTKAKLSKYSAFGDLLDIVLEKYCVSDEMTNELEKRRLEAQVG